MGWKAAAVLSPTDDDVESFLGGMSDAPNEAANTGTRTPSLSSSHGARAHASSATRLQDCCCRSAERFGPAEVHSYPKTTPVAVKGRVRRRQAKAVLCHDVAVQPPHADPHSHMSHMRCVVSFPGPAFHGLFTLAAAQCLLDHLSNSSPEGQLFLLLLTPTLPRST